MAGKAMKVSTAMKAMKAMKAIKKPAKKKFTNTMKKPSSKKPSKVVDPVADRFEQDMDDVGCVCLRMSSPTEGFMNIQYSFVFRSG